MHYKKEEATHSSKTRKMQASLTKVSWSSTVHDQSTQRSTLCAWTNNNALTKSECIQKPKQCRQQVRFHCNSTVVKANTNVIFLMCSNAADTNS